MKNDYQVGAFVKARDGLKEPDYDSILMDNWQGEIIGIRGNTVDVKLDSQTISELPFDYLVRLEEDGLSIEEICLEMSDIEPAEKRIATSQDRKLVERRLSWIALYEKGAQKFIDHFSSTDLNDYITLYSKWIEYLTDNMDFPVEVKVVETMRGGLKMGEKIKLLDLDDFDEKYGILGIGKYQKGAVTWPICDLEVIDKDSKSYQPLKDYCIWFANM